jgi:iron complex outermembrane receptor protein
MLLTTRAALAALALAPTTAWADDQVQTVETVIVTARGNPEDPPVVANARRRLSETPGAVAAVSAESYERRFAPNLADMLRDVPGVYAQKKWGEDVRLAIRGSGIGNSSHNRGVLLAQDGVPFNEADGFGDFQLIDPLTARYTEVWKGGNALRFGGALLGGAVNLVTPTGRTAGHENLLRLDGGSWGAVRGHGQIARVAGDWDVFAAATASSVNGWRAQSDGTARRVSVNLGRAFGEDRELRLIVSAADVEQEIPGAVGLQQALADPRRPNPANLAGEYQRNMRSVRSVLQARWRLSPSLAVDAGAYAVWKSLDHPIFQVIAQDSRNYGAFVRLDWEGALAGRRADAFVGAWLRQGDLDARQFENLKSSRGLLRASSDQNARAADLFAEGRLFVTPALALVGGASAGWTDRSYRNHLNPGLSREKDYSWIAPRVGLLWESPGGAQVYGNLTRSIEPPNFSALVQTGVGFTGFAPLKPQEAWTAELGSRGRTADLVWDVSAYRAELKHELLNFIVDGSVPAATFNAGPTVHQGVEAGLDWNVTPALRLRQTYAWSDFRFAGDRVYGKSRLPVVPEHLYRAELRLEPRPGWFVAPSVEWAPRGAFVDYANSLRAPGYTVWSLNAGAPLGRGVRSFVEIRNLADERYISNFSAVTRAFTPAGAPTPGVSTAVFFPGEARAIFGGITWAY